MIAFCFLTYDEIVNYPIWEAYFLDVPSSEYILLCNPKICGKIMQQPLFCEKVIPNRIINTEWGKFSLLIAQNALQSAALGNMAVEYIVLVSHNSIPVQPFHKLQKYLREMRSSIIAKNIVQVHRHRYGTIRHPAFLYTEFYSMSQWHVLCRRDAEFLVKDFATITTIFGNMVVPDEHVYINYLLHYRRCTDIKYADICHVSWRSSKNTDAIYERGVEVFTHLPDHFIDGLIASNKFFLRKVVQRTRINMKYIKYNSMGGNENETEEFMLYKDRPIII
jgi:hypothetical protein